ncbi:MAG: cyclic nucleotide-binding/CBS domain-containing protein [Thermoplasmata archaeon]
MVLYAKDIMRDYKLTFSKDTNALEAAKTMARDHVGFMVIAENGEIKGMITEWDYVNKVVSKELDPASVKIGDIMNGPVISIAPDTPTYKVAEIMSKNGIRRLPVMENGKLIGVVTSRDILRVFKDYMDSISDIIARFGIL